jgi:aspartate/methionine/tyrosine aminotransferase
MFSTRSGHDPQQNALALAVARLHAAGEELLDLTVSNPTRAGIPYASDAILRALSDVRSLEYAPEPFGIASARDTLARAAGEHGYPIDPSRVVVTASTSEAYSFLFKLLCDPGDEVLVPQPSYPLFEHLATFESVRLVPYALAYDGAWHLDGASVTRAIGPRTRAILAVSPNNPTGSYLKRDELRALAATGLPIVSDEVFARYPLREDPTRAMSALDVANEASLVFAMGGLSKLAALPQMKLAWTLVGGRDPRVVDDALARLELIADSFLSVSAPVQHALPVLLQTSHVAENAIRARTRANLAKLTALHANAGLAATVLDCEGGWYATIRLPHTKSEEAWTLDLLARDRVYVHPGHFFDFAREAYVVVSLLTPEETFATGVARLLAHVDAEA